MPGIVSVLLAIDVAVMYGVLGLPIAMCVVFFVQTYIFAKEEN